MDTQPHPSLHASLFSHQSCSSPITLLLSLPQPSLQTTLEQESNATLHSWVVKQACSLTDKVAVETSHGTSAVPPVFHSAWSSYCIDEVLPDETPVVLPDLTKTNELMGCEVSNIECNGKDVFENDLSGTKRKRNMQLINNPPTTVLSGASHASSLIQASVGGQVSSVNEEGEDLELKKKKLLSGGSALDAVWIRNLSNITCNNSQETLDLHLSGKKHPSQAVKTSHGTLGVPSFFHSARSGCCIDQLLPNETSLVLSHQTKSNKLIRCEVCNIECNSKDVLEKQHLSGKKHQRNMQLKNNPSTTILSGASNASSRIQSSVRGQVLLNTEEGRDLESKKYKHMSGGATLDSVRLCTLGNVACNSQEALSLHLSGKKHIARAVETSHGTSSGMDQVLHNETPVVQPYQTKTSESIQCEVCNIECNSKDVLEEHLSGKKHQRNMQLKNNPSTTILSSASHASSEIQSSVRGEVVFVTEEGRDLESKKKKLLSGGAAFGSVRLCTFGNVACNSQEALGLHLSGKEHFARAVETSHGTSGVIDQVLHNETPMVQPDQTKTSESIRCEVCNIECNSKDVLEEHLSGKKHQRNMQLKNNPSTTILSRASHASSEIQSSVRGEVVFVTEEGRDLESKKKKLSSGGAALGSVRLCTFGNVACNSQEALGLHLSGKEHVAQAVETSHGTSGVIDQVLHNETPMVQPNQTKTSESIQCEVCNIECNSKDVLEEHLSGKKHQRNMQLKNNPSTTILSIASHASSEIQSSVRGEVVFVKEEGRDLESKKKKLLSSGAALDSVRFCNLCNVACNSQEAFNLHLTGKKHAARVCCTSKNMKVAQLTRCGVCNIECNSRDVYISHLTGKNHLKNLKKLSKSVNNGLGKNTKRNKRKRKDVGEG